MSASDKTVSITINAKDATKAVFAQLATGAEKLGSELVTAGRDGAKGLGQVDAAARSSGDAMVAAGRKYEQATERMNEKISDFGLRLKDSLTAGIQEVARLGDQAQQTDRQLSAAFEAIGQSAEDFKSQIDDVGKHAETLGINNDTAKQALQALISTTGDAAASFGLIGTAEDLAAAKGISLTQAATVLGKVYDGNTASAKRLGIEVDANASSTEVLTQISERYAGQAEAHSTVTSRLAAELENEKEKLASLAAGWVPYIAALSQAGEGVALAVSGAKALAATLEASRAAAAAASLAMEAEAVAATEVATTGEAAAIAEAGVAGGLLGPIGLVVGLGAAAAAFYLLTRSTQDNISVAKAATDANDALTLAIQNLAASGSPNASPLKAVQDDFAKLTDMALAYADSAKAAQDAVNTDVVGSDQWYQDLSWLQEANAEAQQLALSSSQIGDVSAKLADLFSHPSIDAKHALSDVESIFKQFQDGTITADQLAASIAWLDTNWFNYSTTVVSASEATTALNAQIQKLKDSASSDLLNQALGGLETKPIQDVIDGIFGAAEKGAAAYQGVVSTILDEVKAGTLTAAEGYQRLIDLGERWTQHLTAEAAAAEAASVSMADMNAVLDQQAIAAGGTADALDKLSKAQQGNRDTPLVDHGQVAALDDERRAAEAAAVALTHLSSLGPKEIVAPNAGQGKPSGSFALDSIGLATGNVTQETDLLATAQSHLAASFAQSYDAAIKTAAGYVQASGGLTSYLNALQHSSGNSRVVQVASDLSDVNARLATMTEVVIDNTDAIGKSSQKLSDWATTLIAPVGTLGEIDDLLAKGAISQSTYNAAQAAGTRIFADNARVQQDLEVIQAKQAPLLADLADKQAQYMDQLAGQPAAVQAAALGWQDLGEQQKAQSIIALASSATSTDAAQAIIDAATAADPYLEAMLEQLGVIDKDHKVTIKADGFDKVATSIDDMTNALNVLIGLLNPSGTASFDTEAAQDAAQALIDKINGIPPDSDPNVTAHVFGTSDVSALATEIGNLYDRNIYVNTYLQTIDLGRNATPGAMLGGVIQRHASGGVASLLAEVGPEWLDFPNGGHGMAWNKGVYNVPEGTYVHTAPATKAMGKDGGAPQNFYGPLILQAASGDLHAELNRSAITRNRRA